MNKSVYIGPAATPLSLFMSLPDRKCKHSYTLLPYPAHPSCSHSISYVASVVPSHSSILLHSCEILGSEESGTLACKAVLDQCSKWLRYSGTWGCVGSVFLMIQVLWHVRLCWISVSGDSSTLACEAVLEQCFQRFRYSGTWDCVGSGFLVIQVLWDVRLWWISVSSDSGTLACEAVLDQCFQWFGYSGMWGCVGSVFLVIQVLWHVRLCLISVSNDSGVLEFWTTKVCWVSGFQCFKIVQSCKMSFNDSASYSRSESSLHSSEGKRLSRTKLMITQDCDVSGQHSLLWGPISGKALHSRGLRSKDGGISNSAYVKLNIPHVT